MRDRIPIEKELIPYSFEILLGAELYELGLKYNEKAELFTVTLSKDGEVLVYDEPIIYGNILFASEYQNDLYPALEIQAWDESGEETEITYDNFGETVFLTIYQGGDDDEAGDI